MTVIATLRIEGIPAAIGDFITSDAQVGVKHDFVPTRPTINDAGHRPLPRRIHGLRRKLHRVNPRLLVAYTGLLQEAGVALAELDRHFGQLVDGPTLNEIDGVLRPFRHRFAGKLTLIGWTARSRPRCFKWAAEPNASVVHVTQAIEGSGAQHFREMLTNAHSHGYSSNVVVAHDKATLLGITNAGKVLLEEMTSGGTLENSYGYGAELALFNGREFQFVRGIAYTFWNVRIEIDGSIRFLPANVFAAYESHDRYCVMQVSHLGVADSRLKVTNTYSAAISPPHEPLINFQVGELRKEIDLSEVHTYFNGIAFFDARTGINGKISVSNINSQSTNDWFFRIRRQDGTFHFEWKRNEFEALILEAVNNAPSRKRN
jgi:hypothetical protein